MATYTSNYNLKKPDTSDFIDVTDINENMDSIDNALNDKANLTYCTCLTASGIADKVATIATGTFALETGVAVDVKFTYANSVGSPTLNVNGTGAKPIKLYGTTSAYTNMWQPDSIVRLIYDGTNWILQNGGTATTTYFGVTKLSSSTTSTSVSTAATSSAVKAAYDLASEAKTALNNKVDKEDGKGLSSNDYTAADKTKVANMATNIKNGTNPGALQGIMGCTAGGSGAVAFGETTNATGTFSLVAGMRGKVTGPSGASLGYYTNASGYGQVVVGKYNKEYAGPTGGNDATGTQFIVGVGTDDTKRSNAFRVTADGNCLGQNAFIGSGADYSECFEWADGNPEGEDRRGYFVTLEGNKIRKATAGDSYIAGIVSATPMIVGNAYNDEWHGMYMRDIFGERLKETVEVEESVDPNTGETVPAHTETRFILNPEYDPEKTYLGRLSRVEWNAVGSTGQFVVIDDGTCKTDGFCQVANGGVATKANGPTEFRVIERLDDTHIRIYIK